jgi:hypothetical protein
MPSSTGCEQRFSGHGRKCSRGGGGALANPRRSPGGRGQELVRPPLAWRGLAAPGQARRSRALLAPLCLVHRSCDRAASPRPGAAAGWSPRRGSAMVSPRRAGGPPAVPGF